MPCSTRRQGECGRTQTGRSPGQAGTGQPSPAPRNAGYSGLLISWPGYRHSLRILAILRDPLQMLPEVANVLLSNGFKVISARRGGQFPKLDVVGSNPIAR